MNSSTRTVTNNMTISSLKRSISSIEAVRIIQPFIKNYIPVPQKLLYYPYYWVFFSYTVNTIIGRSRQIEASCFVDMINNIVSTTDSFEKEETEAISENVLSPSISEKVAFNSARKYLTHASILKMKAFLVPDVEVLEEKLLYKPFWIIKCSNKMRESFNIMVDAVTGKYQTL